MIAKTIQKVNGGYIVDGIKMPSVTTILGAMYNHNTIEKWKEKTVNHKEITKRAATLGSLMHLRLLNQISYIPIELDKMLPIDDWPDDVIEIMEAREQNFKKLNVEFGTTRLVEQIVYHRLQPQYAGTADFIGDIWDWRSIADMKSSRRSQKTHVLQLGGYMKAAESMGLLKGEIERGFLFYIRETDAEFVEFDRKELEDAAEEFTDITEKYHEKMN